MISIIKKLRQWLDPDGQQQSDTDRYISELLALMKSREFSDFNAKKQALNRLIRLTAAADAAASSASKDDLESMINLSQITRRAREEERNLMDSHTLEALEPIISDIDKLKIGSESNAENPLRRKSWYHNGSKENLKHHLQLMKELREEALLHGQPPYPPPNIGRGLGTNFKLGFFNIPKLIYTALETNNEKILMFGDKLTEENYVKTLQTLVWVEELHQTIELREYDMEEVKLVKYQDFFLIPVPGLAEGRPSLMMGDRVVLKGPEARRLCEGYIHQIRSKDVLVKLHPSLHSNNSQELHFGVRFQLTRTCFRRCHQGIQQYTERGATNKIVFPKLSEPQKKEPMIDVTEVTQDKLRCLGELNLEQRRAVIAILRGESRPAPYIIFGPPGTGKTVTLVESILQVYSRMPSSRILVCGNSNSCVDVLAERILNSQVIPEDQLIRLSALYRMEKLIPEGIKNISKDMESISDEMFIKSRVIITTCIQAGALNYVQGSFDYLFIDEAGHASEPEALVPLGLLKPEACVVLAGDPRQLGPVVKSPVAFKHGLGLSLLERLSELDLYQRKRIDESPEEAYDSRYITKLLVSYRSDARVFGLNNRLFYNNELKFINVTPKYLLRLLCINNPLVFHSVKGQEQRDLSHPSWYNPKEAITCLNYVERLYAGGLKPDQLGIITPYRRQIQKLNLMFDGSNLERCKIATMEEFQGDEREVIIISTVRTRKSNMQVDKKFNLGFLFNEKRFNVGISRAMWLVIVIGNFDLLKGDTCWSEYVKIAQCIGHMPPKKQLPSEKEALVEDQITVKNQQPEVKQQTAKKYQRSWKQRRSKKQQQPKEHPEAMIQTPVKKPQNINAHKSMAV